MSTPAPTPQYPFPDLTLPPETILMNMLNLVNAATLPQPLTTDECVFGDPSPFGGTGANTQIPFGTTNPAVFGTGTVTVHYTRIDVSKVVAPAQPATVATMMSGALAAINTEYGLNIQASDIIDAPITNGVGNLNIKPTSMIYAGNIQLTFSSSTPTPSPAPTPTPTPPPAPVPNFIHQADSENPLQVQFTDTSDDQGSTVTGWAWAFGDTNTSTVQNPQHTYAAAGTYSVELTITDAHGSHSTTQSVVVTAADDSGLTPTPGPTPTPTPTPTPSPTPTPTPA